MKFKIGIIPLVVGITLSTSAFAQMEIKTATDTGRPSFVTGNLGNATAGAEVQALKQILVSNPSYKSTGSEEFEVSRQWVDELGKKHTFFDQKINGIKVYGNSIALHTEVSNNANGLLNNAPVYAVTGALAVSSAPASAAFATKQSNDNGKQARSVGESIGSVQTQPELAYIYLPDQDEAKLAWRMEVVYFAGAGPFGRDIVYIDAATNEVLARHAQVHSAKSWKTYTLNGGNQNSAPGQLLCTNNQNCGGNAAAQRAHDGAATVYDYYQQRHGRDSLNNNGMTLVSSVDLGEQNAYWTGSQMLYGQAGGGVDYDFTSDFDIIGHEFTHGVTNFSARLVYQNAPGALNEAWSDILGLSAEAFKNGTTTSSWLLGDGLYNQPGKAFRYMNDPTKDNYSKDWYPERIPFSNNPNRDNDYGGVHGNSGIANLAYVLLVDGGTHPRGKSNAQVPGIGMLKAEKIFYRALVTYMNQNTNFSGARTATAQAAQDLYGATEKNAVETAWCAVGVGDCPTTTPPPPPPTGDNELQNGVPVTGISGAAKDQKFYTFQVPAGATNLRFVTMGGSGDADLYVKFGSKPSLSTYDCKSTTSSSNETCAISNIQTGTYHVMVEAWNQISGVTLTASYDGGTTPPPPPSGPTPIYDTLGNISVGGGQWQRFTQELGTGYSTMTITTSGGYGDVDLYVRKGSDPTLYQYDCRPWKNGNNESCTFTNPGAGTWHIGIYGYYNSSGVTLTLTAE